MKNDSKKVESIYIDSFDPEVKKEIEECRRKQQECLDRKTVDWDKLSRIYITI